MQEGKSESFLARQRVCDILLHALCARCEMNTCLAEVFMSRQGSWAALRSRQRRQGDGARHDLKTEQLRHLFSVWPKRPPIEYHGRVPSTLLCQLQILCLSSRLGKSLRVCFCARAPFTKSVSSSSCGTRPRTETPMR